MQMQIAGTSLSSKYKTPKILMNLAGIGVSKVADDLSLLK
jgi:hypothetical protein